MKEKKNVIINEVTGEGYWYQGLEGRMFMVYEYSDEDYVLAEDYDRGPHCFYRHILKADCKLVA